MTDSPERFMAGDLAGAVRPRAAEPEAPAVPVRQERAWSNDHPVNLRLSIFGLFYLTIVAGRERRSRERRADERVKHPLITFGNLTVIFGLGVFCGLAILAMIQMLGAFVLLRAGAVTGL